MTVQLADFFRSSVAAGRQHLIPLSEELMLVGTYLDIEGVRYGKRLGVSVTKGTGTDTVRVPPLILQPLVENAIKHGIANLLDGGTIEIESRLAADMLSILIRNPVDPGPPTGQTKGTGFGVQAVRDRLKAIAPEKGFLDVRQSEDYYEAVIGLPTDLR